VEFKNIPETKNGNYFMGRVTKVWHGKVAENIYFWEFLIRMKYIVIIMLFAFLGLPAKAQNAPKVFDPCQKLDTNKIKQLIPGTWVDVSDTSHTMVITEDSLTESILITEGLKKKVNVSYWSYKFTDNMFSSDAVTCYSIVEYKEGYSRHSDYAINAIDDKYLLLGSTGKTVFKRKN